MKYIVLTYRHIFKYKHLITLNVIKSTNSYHEAVLINKFNYKLSYEDLIPHAETLLASRNPQLDIIYNDFEAYVNIILNRNKSAAKL